VGGLVLGIFTVRRNTVRALTTGTVVRPLLVCAVSTGVFQAALMSSVVRTGAALATVVALGVAPAAIGLCARWVTGERMTAVWMAGTAAAVTGGALILTGMITMCLPPRFFPGSARMPGISRDRRITSAETLEPLASGERSSEPASQFRTSA
jgi:hypothetical protein